MVNQETAPDYMDSRLENTLQAQLNQSLHFTGCMGVNVVITDSRNVSIQQTLKTYSLDYRKWQSNSVGDLPNVSR